MISVIPGDTHYLGLTAIVTVGMQLAFFAVATTFKFDKVTDFAGSTNFAVLALLTFFLARVYSWRQIVITVAICLWSLRLASYLLYRILVIGKDSRFDETRDNFCRFLGFWVYQMMWVWIVSLPVIFLNSVPSANQPEHVKGTDVAGIVIASVALIGETIADQQKFNFKRNDSNRGKWCQAGLWGYSRHPNYFFEIMFWWGIFIFASSVFKTAGSTWGIATIVGPLWLTFILLLVSGVPPLEKSANERYGSRSDYVEYKERVPCLIPFFPSAYREIPAFVKVVLCFEWPMYQGDSAASDTEILEQYQGYQGEETSRVNV